MQEVPETPESRASEQAITRRRLHVYQKGDHIKDIGGNRWDMTSQSTEGVWYRVSFAGESPTCKCVCHTTERVQVQAYGGGRGACGHHNQNTGALLQGGVRVCQDRQAAVRGGQVRLRRGAPEGPRQGVVYGSRHGPLHQVHPGMGHIHHQRKV